MQKYVALYFSAHWCPPCRQFTPYLAELYEDQDNKETEVVFISSDQDAHSFSEYFGSMPWAAVPFEASKIRQQLSSKYGISGIPSLIILNAADGSIVTKDGRGAVMRKRSLTAGF